MLYSKKIEANYKVTGDIYSFKRNISKLYSTIMGLSLNLMHWDSWADYGNEKENFGKIVKQIIELNTKIKEKKLADPTQDIYVKHFSNEIPSHALKTAYWLVKEARPRLEKIWEKSKLKNPGEKLMGTKTFDAIETLYKELHTEAQNLMKK